MAIIGLDATSLSVYGKGVSRYQHNLIKGLYKIDKKNCYYIFLNKKYAYPQLPQQDNLHYTRIYIPSRIIWDQFQLPLLLKKYKVDIYHTALDTLPLFTKIKFILFIFEIPDYRIKLMSQGSRRSLYTKISYKYNELLFPYSLRKASIIITSSYSTERDLIQKYGIDEKKMRIIYPAADEQFCPCDDGKDLVNIKKKYNAERGYILHFSSSDPRDNTAMVIRAYGKAKHQARIPHKLIIAGNIDTTKASLNRLIEELDLKSDIEFCGYLSGKDLTDLYRAADLYIDPSLYEGFGFQVLEAMACGIPVITSNIASLPEVVGNAGILVDPTDINGLVTAIVRVATDTGLRDSMRQKGLEKAISFSWDKAAGDNLAIYEEIVSQGLKL